MQALEIARVQIERVPRTELIENRGTRYLELDLDLATQVPLP